LADRRERKRFQIQSFERFRRELTEDENLRRIGSKKEPLTDSEIDDYLGFFEEVGIYFAWDLVDVRLVDEIMGDEIVNAWNDYHIRESIGAIRAAEDDPTYFKYFEQLARHLKRLKEKRVGS
jgi:hypothetical protein